MLRTYPKTVSRFGAIRGFLRFSDRFLFPIARQLLKALPKMAKKATNPDLKRAIESHLKEPQDQVNRLEEAFGESATKDAMLIACAEG
jgi:ferritin-like metal-binding protein YciE